MKNKEIERKFLIDINKIPYDLGNMNYQDIVQGYITSIDNSFVFRLRQVIYFSPNNEVLGDDYFQTIKGKGSKIRDEFETRLLRNQFSSLWTACENLQVHKYRYELPSLESNNTLYLDKYKNELTGFYTLEVEFNTLEECEKYIPEDWFGEEVTEDNRYSNISLAKNGLPKNESL